jgi:NitT/TauT family transport system substrate-binding protein
VDAQIISLGDTVAALANGSLDGGVLIEPFRTAALAQGHSLVWKDSEQVLPNDQTGVLVMSPQLANDRPEMAERFMAGYLQGVRRYNDAFFKGDAEAREDTIEILTRYTALKDRALYDRIIPGGLNPDGKVSLERLQHYSNYFISRGYQQVAPNWDALVDPRFANAAVARLGGPYQ